MGLLPDIEWRKPKRVSNREMVKDTIPVLNGRKPHNLELAVPKNYLLLHIFHAIDLFVGILDVTCKVSTKFKSTETVNPQKIC